MGGGKRQLLPELRRFYPPAFSRYIEPFVGSGAVFFDLYGAGRLRGREAILIDSNADLIACYETVRDAPNDVARALDDLAAGHARDGSAHYYRVRDGQFNPLRARLRQADGRISYSPELAAMFVYLNRTGFNGLFRLNASGAFNVPAGGYERPRIADRDKILRVASALAVPGVTLVFGTFALTLEIAAPGDFLYFDPPHAPAERHLELHVIHRQSVWAGRPGTPAARRRGAGAGEAATCCSAIRRRKKFTRCMRQTARRATQACAAFRCTGSTRHQQQSGGPRSGGRALITNAAAIG